MDSERVITTALLDLYETSGQDHWTLYGLLAVTAKLGLTAAARAGSIGRLRDQGVLYVEFLLDEDGGRYCLFHLDVTAAYRELAGPVGLGPRSRLSPLADSRCLITAA
jgi:hypothetical protein